MDTTSAQVAADEIVCPAGHAEPMELRPATKQTPEQLWCGTWYDCTHAGCGCSVLIQSDELAAYHAPFHFAVQVRARHADAWGFFTAKNKPSQSPSDAYRFTEDGARAHVARLASHKRKVHAQIVDLLTLTPAITHAMEAR